MSPDAETLPAVAPRTSALDRVPLRLGVAPTSIEEGIRLSRYFAESELVPKNFRNKPADILVAIQMGIEIGFAPMQALQSIAVINGRPGVWGDGFLALLMASPLYQDHDEFYEVDGQRRDGLVAEDLKKDTTVAVCTFWRRGKPMPVTRRFTIAQAKKAGLLGKEGPWQTYPDRMLAMRARAFAGRDTFPDVLRGISTAEELRDVPAEDVIDHPRLQRISETPAARSAAAVPGTVTPAGSLAGDSGVADIGASKTAASSPAAVPPVTSSAPGVDADVTVTGKVNDVQQFLGGFTLVLTTGESIDVAGADDALELEKFKGRKDTLKLVCERTGPATLRLKSFAIAD